MTGDDYFPLNPRKAEVAGQLALDQDDDWKPSHEFADGAPSYLDLARMLVAMAQLRKDECRGIRSRLESLALEANAINEAMKSVATGQ